MTNDPNNAALALAKPVAPVAAQAFTTDQIDLIKRTICQGATNDELKLFLYQAQRTGLDPLARQIHAVKRWDSRQEREVMAIQTSIDGFRLIAERTEKYAGQLGPFWCDQGGEWKDIWTGDGVPYAAKVGVLRSDFKEPLWATARFDAYAGRKRDGSLNRFWNNMGDLMIGKCAEALALRRAFPQELSGIYTTDEMQQADNEAPTDAPAVEEPREDPRPAAAPAKERDPRDPVVVKPAKLSDGSWGVQLPQGERGAQEQVCIKETRSGNRFAVTLLSLDSSSKYGEKWETTGERRMADGEILHQPELAATPDSDIDDVPVEHLPVGEDPPPLTEDDIPF